MLLRLGCLAFPELQILGHHLTASWNRQQAAWGRGNNDFRRAEMVRPLRRVRLSRGRGGKRMLLSGLSDVQSSSQSRDLHLRRARLPAISAQYPAKYIRNLK